MADPDKARRAAEKAARQALEKTYVSTIGDLGVHAARDTDAKAAITAARQSARELLARARSEGAELVQAARADAALAATDYADAHDRAIAVGWTPTALRDMGYTPPTRRRTPTAAATTDSPAPPADNKSGTGEPTPAATAAPPATPPTTTPDRTDHLPSPPDNGSADAA